MSNTWKELDAEQKREAPPSTCRYCGEPIYWETLRSGKKQPVNATDFERHVCEKRGVAENRPRKEAEMPTDKGKCPHGEFILTEGCPQCIAERQAQEADKAEAMIAQDTESLATNQQGQLELVVIKEEDLSLQEDPAPELIGTQLAEEAGIVEAEDESYHAPYNASYHAPYRLQDGSIVPGVTTVLGILEKPGLHYWIADTTKAGQDWVEVRDAAGRVGTITHHLIASHLKGERPETGEYSPVEVEKAKRCYKKYLAWEKENPLEPVMIEERLVSEEFKYGGTPDLLAEIKGKFVLIDFKTSGRIYDRYLHQVAAYRKLLEEQGWEVAKAWILRISPDDDQYELGIQLDFERDWQIFQHALAIYRLQEERRA